jgi:hypothetical protein
VYSAGQREVWGPPKLSPHIYEACLSWVFRCPACNQECTYADVSRVGFQCCKLNSWSNLHDAIRIMLDAIRQDYESGKELMEKAETRRT